MPTQIIGNNTGGTTNNYVSAKGLIYPTAVLASGTSPVLRAFYVRLRATPNLTFAVYENTTDDINTATLLNSEAVDPFKNLNAPDYTDDVYRVNMPLTAGRYYWIGVFCGGSYYLAGGGGASWLGIDSAVDSTPVSVVGTTAASGENLNVFAEIVDKDEQATVVIGQSPNSTALSLLKAGVAYQAENAQIRHNIISDNLHDVTVFDDGRFLVGGKGSDAFAYELAAPSQAFGAAQTATIIDATVEVIV